MRHSLTMITGAAMTVAVLFFVGGCDGGGESSESPDTVAGGGRRLVLAGGPAGGTFEVFARAINRVLTEQDSGIEVELTPSGGSGDNVRLLGSGEADMAICYAGDVWLTSRAQSAADGEKGGGVQPMGYLYGAPAQLVVPAHRPIGGVEDLAGLPVAVGNAGSGAALAAERFFRHLGLWQRLDRHHLGYSQAATAMIQGKLAAFWALVGYPASAVAQAAASMPIRLLDIGALARSTGFYQAYPFYSPVSIPAGTYPGMESPCRTFQDSALLCAARGVDQELVHAVMSALWSDRALAMLRQAHPSAAEMGLASGYTGAPVPLSPGAWRFWREQGKKPPLSLRP